MKTALNRIFPSTTSASSPEAPAGSPTAPPQPGVERACPECGSAASPDQDWCLECGARLEQPGAKWQQPVAIMASVALIFVAAIALALSEVAKDAEIAKAKTVRRYVAAPPPPAATTPPAPAEPTPSDDTSTPSTSKNPTDSSTPSDSSSSDTGSTDTSGVTDTSGLTDTGGGGYVPPPADTTPAPPPEAVTWPDGKKAYTVVLLSTTSKDEANALALKARKKGIPAGILQSDNYKNLSSGLWIVWAGTFSTEDAAYAAATDYASKGYDGESVEYIRTKGSDDGNSGDGSTTDTTTTGTTTTGTTDTTDGG